MSKEEKLDDYIKYGLLGVPEIKREEKEKYLGEFQERVIATLDMLDIQKEEKVKEIESILKKDKGVAKVIVHEKVNTKIRIRFMKLSKDYNKDFKVVEKNTDIAIVLAKVF